MWHEDQITEYAETFKKRFDGSSDFESGVNEATYSLLRQLNRENRLVEKITPYHLWKRLQGGEIDNLEYKELCIRLGIAIRKKK